MKKEMLINVLQPEESRIAIVEDGILEELYVERTSHESYVGNIYKGRIVNIEPSIQAAFVDFGVGRNGFLHVSDVEPAYYRHLEAYRADSGVAVRGRDRFRGQASARPSTVKRPEAEGADESPSSEESEPSARRGRRGRGRGRRSGRGAAPAAGSTSARSAANEEPQERPASFPTADPHGEAPPSTSASEKYMDSADRRTDADRPPREAEHDSSAFSPRPEVHRPPSGASPAAQPPFGEATAFDADVTDASEDPGESWAEIDDDSDTSPDAERQDEEADDLEARPRRGRFRDQDRGRRSRRGRGPAALGRPKPPIQEIFRRGQEVLVQVIKEGIGTKGPTLSTYISIAGRYLVLMPGLNRIGVSRKIADDEQRRRLREVLGELQPPRGIGFIIRTAGLDKTKKELQRDLAYLSRLWQVVVRRIRKMRAPAEIYQESDMITRTIRDTFTSEIDTIWVDEPAAYEHAQEFAQIVMPRYVNRIKQYAEPEPLFHRYGIEDEIARIQRRHVPLPNGGSIVIDPTEALVAIDVNSGNFRADNNAEETAYQMNLMAAKEIARQLRLRDLGGVIVNDFIDMRDEKHRRGVERVLREAVRRDRARTKILKISPFGIIEMTRQRIRPSLKRSVYQDCVHCAGTGQVKTCESMSIDVMRMLQLAAHRGPVSRIQVTVAEDVASYLLNRKRKEISRLEEEARLQITVTGLPGAPPERLEFVCYDPNNSETRLAPYEDNGVRRR